MLRGSKETSLGTYEPYSQLTLIWPSFFDPRGFCAQHNCEHTTKELTAISQTTARTCLQKPFSLMWDSPGQTLHSFCLSVSLSSTSLIDQTVAFDSPFPVDRAVSTRIVLECSMSAKLRDQLCVRPFGANWHNPSIGPARNQILTVSTAAELPFLANYHSLVCRRRKRKASSRRMQRGRCFPFRHG